MACTHIEAAARPAQRDGAASWLSELVWRDFYHQILHHHPHVVGASFKPEYDKIRWEHGKHADELFAAWCEGRTGYPLVDAAMAQINQSGYMRNRLRMVVASFLVKDLGIDWRRGERYFAQMLNDFDLAANWEARPIDLESAGITLGRDYPQPLVQHDAARAKTLERYAVVKR